MRSKPGEKGTGSSSAIMTITQHKLLALFGGAVVALITISVNALFLSFNTMGNIIFYGTGHYTVTEQIESSTILGLII